ncbi:MAG: glycoside hydrolase family 31 protein [Acutalibacteraceae bacterium]
MLVVKNDGTPLISNWWNGFSASLDFANPFAVKWFDKKLKNLIYKYNIDGFKFDGGDASYYMHENINGNLALNRYGNYGANFSYNEFRTSFQNAGKPIAQRFVNVYHEWDSWGINQMIPAAIAQGVLGYAFTCPDMVGGGDNSRLADSSDLEMVDEELFVRSAEVCALMPMMQFCASPWKKLRPQNAAICRKMAELHNEYADVILELVENASVTGEPIIRALDYVFPNQNLVKITDQFMLGNEIMVAPVIEEGARKRTVKLPQGRWKYHDRIIHGGKTMEISVPLDELPIFTLVSSDN